MLFKSRIASTLLCAGLDLARIAFAIRMYLYSSRGRMLSVYDALFDYARLLLCANDADKIVKSIDEIVMLPIATI